MDITKANLTTLYQGFKAVYDSAYQACEVLWPQIATEAPSDSKTENYGWLAALPGMKELLGEVVVKNIAAASYQIANKEFESTVAVKEADVRGDRVGIYKPLFAELGNVAATHPDTLLAALVESGWSALCYTGKPFFADNHAPQKGTGKFSNKGTAALDAEAFEAARASLKGRKNAEGRPMGIGRKLVLMVPPALEGVARRILEAELSAEKVGSNTVATTNVNKGTATVLVNPYLTSDTKWYLFETANVLKPFIFQRLLPTQLTAMEDAATSDHVFKRHEFLYQAYGIYNVGFGLPEYAYASDGTV